MTEDHLDPSGAARLYSVARALTGALTAGEVATAVFEDRPDDVATLVLRWSPATPIPGPARAPEEPPDQS